MAGEPDQLPLDDGLQRSERADGQSRGHPAEITRGRGSGDNTLERPNLNSILDPDERPDSATGQKTGVDSE